MTGELDLLLPKPERLAAGDSQLQFDQVEPSDRLGDGMLDLKARVHLHEIEFAVLVEQEFQGSGTLITNRFDGVNRDGAHASSQFWRDLRRRRFLDQLLVPSLQRAVAFPQMNGVTESIAKYLDFDVARINDRALQEHGSIAERILRLRARSAQGIGEGCFVRDQPHATPAAAGNRLDH